MSLPTPPMRVTVEQDLGGLRITLPRARPFSTLWTLGAVAVWGVWVLGFLDAVVLVLAASLGWAALLAWILLGAVLVGLSVFFTLRRSRDSAVEVILSEKVVSVHTHGAREQWLLEDVRFIETDIWAADRTTLGCLRFLAPLGAVIVVGYGCYAEDIVWLAAVLQQAADARRRVLGISERAERGVLPPEALQKLRGPS